MLDFELSEGRRMLFKKNLPTLGMVFRFNKLFITEVVSGRLTLYEEIPLLPEWMERDYIVNEDAIVDLLKGLIKEKKWNKASVRLGIPSNYVILRKIFLPQVAPKEVKQLLDFEIQNNLPLPFEIPVYDYAPLEKFREDEEGKKQEYLIIAAPFELVDGHAKALRRAGLVPKSADLEFVSLLRVLKNLKSDDHSDSGSIIFMQVNDTIIDLSVFTNGIPEFIRSIDRSIPDFEDSNFFGDKSSLFDDYGSSVLSELSRILNFYQYTMYEGKQKVSRVYISGNKSAILFLVGYLTQSLNGITVDLFPSEAIKLQKLTEEEDDVLKMIIPYGLATRRE